MVENFVVPLLKQKIDFQVQIPGSKSITNRALLLAALSQERICLDNVLFSDDSRHFLQCLQDLGFFLEIDEPARRVSVIGTGGRIPRAKAEINVGSAGTAARFLTAFLAACGGEYKILASPQMMSRPMKPLLEALISLGVEFEFLQQEWCLPFAIKSSGLVGGKVKINAERSSQFLSALLMVGAMAKEGLIIEVSGDLPAKPYVEMTLQMMQDFGVEAQNEAYQSFKVPVGDYSAPMEYLIEPDLSNANYFLALATLTGSTVFIPGVRIDSLQGDLGFLKILRQMGSELVFDEQGVFLKGSGNGVFPGVDADLSGMPDQTMTLAALAPFATSPTTIRNIGVIKYHESNRFQAIITELTKLGIRVEAEDDNLIIYPGMPKPGLIETYDDHRIAMAFALLGLRAPGIMIANPDCTKKTFENYFELFQEVVQG